MRPIPPRAAVRRPLAVAASGALAAGLLVGLVHPPAGAAQERRSGGGSSDVSAARMALARAELALGRSTAGGGARRSASPPPASPRASAVDGTRPPRQDATLVLRDLELQRADLPAAERGQADDLLARPATSPLASSGTAVVHGTLGPGLTAAYAQQVLATVTHVQQTYLAAGYRAPLPDGDLGGDPRLDVYLADLAPTGAYGYCTSDQELRPSTTSRWAFCVLDDSYVGYPGGNPTELLQVTTAHELFHAVQYAYDSLEDGWFLEGTAAWVEDVVFPEVDDNLQYLPFSPLASPRSSLDIYDPAGFRQYGSWVFFRWLSERFPAAQGGMPVIVRQVIEASGSGDRYSTQAVSGVLKQYGLRLDRAFALFADANRRPVATYAEARANDYPTAPLAQKVTLSPARRAVQGRTVPLDHLTSATTRFVPQGLGSGTRLQVRIDLADKRTDPVAVVSTYRRGGGADRGRRVSTRVVRLDARGDAVIRVGFASRRVRAIEVTAVNASTRFADCYQVAVTYSCFGRPVHENQPARLSATVLR